MYCCAAKLTENEAGVRSYSEGRYLGKSSTFSGQASSSDTKDYGDDVVAESDTATTGGTITWEANEPTLENQAFVLGHEYNRQNKEMLSKEGDVAPFLGIGAIGKSLRDNQRVYSAKIYTKVKFAEPNDEYETRGESTSFKHYPYTGTIFVPADGEWKITREFDTAEAAKAFLNSTLGITTS